MSESSPDRSDPTARQCSKMSSPSRLLENEALVQSLAVTESRLPAPIDLDLRRVQRIELAPLLWDGYLSLPTRVLLTNTGETVLLSARWTSRRPSVCGGALGHRRYVFSQLHFHWGRTALDGSEHTVDRGFRLPLELHVMHFDEQFGDQETAQRVPGGVLCVVYLFCLQEPDSRFLAPVVDALETVVLPGSCAQLDPFPLSELFQPFSDEYFLYWGSTRRAGSPVPQDFPLLWIVSRTMERLSFAQLKRFNRLLDGRMRPSRSVKPPSVVATANGRHLFHVNRRTALNGFDTLVVEPPPKYSQTHRRSAIGPDRSWH